MSDISSLALVILLCYLMECVVIVQGRPLLITRLFLCWRVFASAGIALPGDKRLLFLNPLPWLAEWHPAPRLACTPTRSGLLPVSSLYGEALPGEADPDAMCADALAEAGLLELGDETTPVRGWQGDGLWPEDVCLRWTDPTALVAKRASVRVLLVTLQVFCTLQLLCWLAAPLVLAYAPLTAVLIAWGAILYCLGASIVLLFLQAWKRLAGRRYGPRALWMFFYPPAATRAVQALAPAMHAPSHESAIICALAGETGASRVYALHLLARLRHCLFSRRLPAGQSAALEEANERLARAVRRHWNLQEDTDAASCVRAEEDAACICPVCGISMTQHMEYCPHCVEVRTLPVEIEGRR